MMAIIFCAGLFLGMLLNTTIIRMSDEQNLHLTSHWIYPLVQLFTAGTLVLLYSQYAFSATFFYLALVCLILIITGTIDWLYRLIDVVFMLGSVPIVICAALAVPSINLLNGILGGLVAGVVFILIWMWAQFLFPGKHAPFGGGDVYLGIFIGAAVGLTRLFSALWYGVLLAGIVAAVIIFFKYALKRTDLPEYLPYGSYLCLGTIIYLLAWGL